MTNEHAHKHDNVNANGKKMAMVMTRNAMPCNETMKCNETHGMKCNEMA